MIGGGALSGLIEDLKVKALGFGLSVNLSKLGRVDAVENLCCGSYSISAYYAGWNSVCVRIGNVHWLSHLLEVFKWLLM